MRIQHTKMLAQLQWRRARARGEGAGVKAAHVGGAVQQHACMLTRDGMHLLPLRGNHKTFTTGISLVDDTAAATQSAYVHLID